jgi:tetratricopeptide (TPR) repeat protein
VSQGTPVTADRVARFKRLMRRGYELVKKSRLHAALETFEEARSTAARSRDRGLADKAIANRSMVLIEMGEYARAARGLKEIILRSRDDETICGAAYNLSISLRRLNQYQKACFYARLAGEKSRAIADPNWIARCHNLMGNLHLVQSRLEPALREYRKALALRLKEKKPNEFGIAILRDNIGYSLLLLGRHEEGIREILQARALAGKVGNLRLVCDCRHDLAFGYMQLRKLQEAEEEGEAALKLAEAIGAAEIVKNCYYILGEINYLRGNEARRDHYFYLLQNMHPHLPFLRDFLCTFDVSNIIALRFP